MRYRQLLFGALALVLLVSACSDPAEKAIVDPPLDPREDGVILVPSEVATLAEALTIAVDGDSLVLGVGTYDGNVTVDKAISIQGSTHVDQWTRLVTDDGPLRVVADGRHVELSHLHLFGGETGLAVELAGGSADLAFIALHGCTDGITIDGENGEADLRSILYEDCGGENGAGAGLRVAGSNAVRVQDGGFGNRDGGSGVALVASDQSQVILDAVGFQDLDAGDGSVVRSTGSAVLEFHDCHFRDCAGANVIELAGLRSSFDGNDLERCRGTLLRVAHAQSASTFADGRIEECSGAFVDLAANKQLTVQYSVFLRHADVLSLPGDGATLIFTNCTLVDLTDPVADTTAGGILEMRRSIVVDAAVPVVLGDVAAIVQCDLWRTDGTNAWSRLETFRGFFGNIEADPLFCDRPDDNYYLAEGSPCLLDVGGAGTMGAFENGCREK